MSKDTIDILNISSAKVIESISVTSNAELSKVLKRSRQAQKLWSALDVRERGDILKAVVDEIRDNAESYAEKLSMTNGKTQIEALIAEILPTMGSFEFFRKNSHKVLKPKNIYNHMIPVSRSRVDYEPLGVVGVISPWNYPFFLSMIHLPAALMAGNTVVIKPSEYSSGAGKLVEEVFQKALPEKFQNALVQVVYGYGDLGQKLLLSGVNKVCFTGSTETGKKVYHFAASSLIPVTLELGGKDAALVLDDADEDKSVDGILWGAFVNSGQTCASVEKMYIPESKFEIYKEKIKNKLESLDEENFGFMTNLMQKNKVEQHLDEAISSGAKVVAQVKRTSGDEKYRLNPTVIENIKKDSKVLTEETFGPLLPLIPYSDLDKAISEINDSPYGLTASVWTKDYSKGEKIAKKLNVGVVTINDHLITPGFPEAPWVGAKESGLGFSNSLDSVLGYCRPKFTYHDRGLLPVKFWLYPLNEKKKKIAMNYIRARFSRSYLVKIWNYIKVLPSFIFKN